MLPWKKYISTILLLVLVYGAYFFTHLPSQNQQKLNVLGASTAITLYQEPDSGRQPILEAITTAQKEIDVEVYLLSDKQIISALEEADARGVNVKVMLEHHPVGSSNLNAKTKQELQSHGVETQWTSPSFALTHEKAMVIDGTAAIVLSQNLTASSFTKNREYDIFDTNPTDIAELQSIFTDDWERKSYTPPSNTNIIESPANSRAALTTLITSATHSLAIETEDINDETIINALSEKAKTIPVRVIAPTLSQFSANKDALKKLSSEGVQIKTVSSPYMHAKMILQDETKAYTGSINLSSQSLDSNREVGIIFTEPTSIQQLDTTFEKDWSKGNTLSL